MKRWVIILWVVLITCGMAVWAQDEPEGAPGGPEPDETAVGAESAAPREPARTAPPKKLQDEAVESLLDSGRPKTTEHPHAKKGAKGATGATGAATAGSTSGAAKTSRGPTVTTRTKAPTSGAVPVVPPAPGEAPTAGPVSAPSPLTVRPATPREPAAKSTTQQSEPATVVPPEDVNATVPAPPRLDTYRTPPPQPAEPPPVAANAAPPAAAEPTRGGMSAAMAIIIGLIALAVLLVVLAAVMGVMAAQRARTSEPPVLRAQPATTGWAYLAAPDAPNISLHKTPFIMGSSPSCDLRLADPKASPQHARIDRTEDGYILTDLNSLNGTLLNGERIASPVSLRPGDEIRMGDITVTFEIYEG